MNKLLPKLYLWYENYVNGFKSIDPELRINISMKDRHTKRVGMNIVDIGNSLNLNADELQFAEAVALLHDVGRFSQYVRYKTFSDAKSEDHAALGVRMIEQQKILSEFDDVLKKMVLKIVHYHNKKDLPQNITDDCLFFLKLLKDADKLDIYKVTTEHYSMDGTNKNKALDLNLPDDPVVSQNVIDDIMCGRTVDFENVKTLIDFKLLQISWMHDIHFSRTKQLIARNNYLEKIYDSMPDLKSVRTACQKIIFDGNGCSK
jgi:hypothetical protein